MTRVEEAVEALAPLERWAHQCHGASLHLVRSGVLGEARVARGSCKGVGGQHSWVVLGDDCYDPDATIVDPTLWSYDDSVTGIYVGPNLDRHTPFGTGSIWQWGRPDHATDTPLLLTPHKPWSREASRFLDLLGPLDKAGWINLAHAPVGAWPAAEILDAMYVTPDPTVPGNTLAGYIPIDIVGMLTDRNPGGLYR